MTAYKNTNDIDLIDLLAADNEQAFTEIYNRYWQTLLTTAYNIIQDEQAAQDAVQNVFVSLWKRRKDVVIHSLKAYLQQAIRYAVLKHFREQRADISFFERLRKITTELIADDTLILKEQEQLLAQILESMPENCSETFRMSREEGLTYKQIASRLKISEKTVEKRLSKSLQYIRKGLSGYVK